MAAGTAPAHTRALAISPSGSASGMPAVGYIGGKALLPADTVVPTIGNRFEPDLRDTLSHIATFSSSALSNIAPRLPEGNIVLLFAVQAQPWTYAYPDGSGKLITDDMDGMQDGHRVIFVPKGADRIEHEGSRTFPQRDLVIVDHLTHVAIDGSHESDEAAEILNQRVREETFRELYPALTVEGPVYAVQNPMEPSLPFTAKIVRGIDTEAADWVCIAQVESLDTYGPGKEQGVLDGSWMWGDVGMLYFWITKADLAEARFDRTICFLQCH